MKKASFLILLMVFYRMETEANSIALAEAQITLSHIRFPVTTLQVRFLIDRNHIRVMMQLPAVIVH